MADSRLAVLVVHDTTFPRQTEASILETEDLTLCHIGNWRYIKEWRTLLEVVADPRQISPRPDLLLIDARFEKDESAPALGRLGIPTGGGNSADPRGLLYGAMIAAQIKPSGIPFGFEIYSNELGSIAEDPYAQTFYGILKSLNEGVASPPEGGRLFETQMKETRRGAIPKGSWPVALKRFRKSLRAAVGVTIAPDYKTFKAATEAVSTFIKTGSAMPAGLSVQWQLRDVSGAFQDGNSLRTVLLSSLYADCRQKFGNGWNPDALRRAGVVEELEDISQAGAFLDDVEQKVRDTFVYTSPEETWGTAKSKRKRSA